MDLHYSQTKYIKYRRWREFESPMDLHYSQTYVCFAFCSVRLNPLWIYTTLKLSVSVLNEYLRLNPLWIYTTLKLIFSIF